MAAQGEQARRFLELHREERPLLLPNPWDRGSARVLASLGFRALATTSSGSAATLGEPDGAIGRERALALARPGVPTVSELASVGVARVSVGGGFAFAALGALVQAGQELRDHGSYGFWEQAKIGARAAQEAFR